MYSLRLRFARWVLRHRGLSFAVFGAITVFFAAGLPRVELATIFSDLLPQDDPFVQVFKDHPRFGSPLTVMVMVQRKGSPDEACADEGCTIYHPDTLAKVWKLTRDIDLTPAVDHEQILSIATEKARYAEATPEGVDMRPLMGGAPPASEADMDEFRARVEKAAGVRTFLISRDESATLIMATLIEKNVDYGVSFRYLQTLVEAARDAQHDVHLTGQPVLIGWVYQYERQMLLIFGVTIAALLVALALYMRNVVGLLTPIITSGVAAIWAFGLVGWMNISIEPLLMVVPLLLIARSFSHSVQFTERYYEIHAEVGDRNEAAVRTMNVMMVPSVLGILTDIFGIVVVAAAPIPAMVRHAIFCGMWAVWLIPTGVVLISLLLATLPAPANHRHKAGGGSAGSGLQQRLVPVLHFFARLSTGTRARATTLVVVIGAAFVIYTAAQIKVGNPVEGSNLLWPESEFNTAVRAINGNFPGVNTLEIVLEAKNQSDPDWIAQDLETVQTLRQLQVLIESGSAPPRATLSFVDYLQEANRLFRGGDPRWLPLDPRQSAVSAAAVGAMMGTSSKNFTHVVSEDMQNATVSLWYPDNRQETVDAALAAATAAVEAVGADHPKFRVRLGTGIIALQEAVNRVIERYQHLVLLLVNVVVFAMCALAYRSVVAGLLLLVPVNLANEALLAAMHLMGVGLDVNSMIVAAIGVGVGIDYGIYLLSRICEEFPAQNGDWAATITAALRTTGKAIFFTASIMTLGIAPWYLMSDLKFVADMGLLLMVIMAINMLLALVVLPLLVWLLRPAFIARGTRWLQEAAAEQLTTTTAAERTAAWRRT
ncbi:MAG: MMPL family transporter [Pseudomonadota bacterium]